MKEVLGVKLREWLRPEVHLLANTPNPQYLIETAARVCYDSEESDNKRSQEALIRHCIKYGHESVLEHASVTYKIKGISRACSHQLVRCRIASYSQRSQRYVLEDDFGFIAPPKIYHGRWLERYEEFMADTKELYMEMIADGVPKEDARFILPNACGTEIVVTMNFRELRHFFNLRALNKKAQWEIRRVAARMLQHAYRVAPVVFEDQHEEMLKCEDKFI